MKKLLLITSIGLLLGSNIFGLTKDQKKLLKLLQGTEEDYRTEEKYKKIEKLVKKIKNLDFKDEEGNTPLHYAIQKGSYRSLHSAGYQLQFGRVKNMGYLKVFKLIAENSKNLNEKNNDGLTPIGNLIEKIYEFKRANENQIAAILYLLKKDEKLEKSILCLRIIRPQIVMLLLAAKIIGIKLSKELYDYLERTVKFIGIEKPIKDLAKNDIDKIKVNAQVEGGSDTFKLKNILDIYEELKKIKVYKKPKYKEKDFKERIEFLLQQ